MVLKAHELPEYKRDLAELNKFVLDPVPRTSDINYSFASSKVRKHVIKHLLINRIVRLDSLTKFFRDIRSYKFFVVQLTQVEGVAKENQVFIWLNPEWVEEQQYFLRKEESKDAIKKRKTSKRTK